VAGTERAYERKHEEEAPEVEQEQQTPEFDARGAVPVTGLANPTVRRAGTVPHDELGGTDVAPDIAATLSRRRGQGTPLPTNVAGSMGAAYGMDFSPVRVHNDREADTISRSLQASAFTYGTDIYFSGGTYQPTSQGGQHLLAHELAHVVQQSTGADSASSSGGPTVGRANDPAETQADAMADQAVSTLRRQAARVDLAPAEAPAASGAAPTEAIRRQAKLVGTPPGGQVIRRGFFSNLWAKIKGKPKKPKGGEEDLGTIESGGSESKDGGTGSTPSSSSGGTGTASTAKPTPPPTTTAPTPSESKDTGGGTGGTTSTGGGTGTTTTTAKVETTKPKEDEKDTAPEAKYPTTVKIGAESVRVDSAEEEEEAKTIVAELETKYGIKLSSATTIAGIKSQYTNVMVSELNKLKASTWEMKELRGLLASVQHFAPILGEQRDKSTLKDKAQGVTSVGKLKNAIDKNRDTGTLDTSTLGEYFGGKSNLGLFDSVTNYKDKEIIREGATGPDNKTGIEATAIHEMAHGLIAPYEINNWVAKLPFWKDRYTESGVDGAEAPPTGYGHTNAAEDLCESVALYFLNKPALQKKCPERCAFLEKVVQGWTPKETKAVLEGATKATGTEAPPEDGKAA
jgi:hypothetical protein